MFYVFDNNNIITEVSAIYQKTKQQVASNDVIPLINAKLLNGTVYDDRDISYQRAIKRNALSAYMNLVDNSGFATGVDGGGLTNIKVECTRNALRDMSTSYAMFVIEAETTVGKVQITTYDGDITEITLAKYKKIFEKTSRYIKNSEDTETTIKKAIRAAATIAEVQAIVIPTFGT